MELKNSLFGFFFQVGFDSKLKPEDFSNIANVFRAYVWGSDGVNKIFEKIKYDDYGLDLKLVLFEFYVNPIPAELQKLKTIKPYRKKEKSIGIPIVINKENFFDRSEEERVSFLIQSIIQKLDLIEEIVTQKKLDTNMKLLKSDIQSLFE